MHRVAILYALAAAALFGASTPLAKLLVGQTAPLILAGLLYLGSGLGLLVWFALHRAAGERPANLSRSDLPWLGGAIAAGGIAAPALLMYGLTRSDGATASLLLNLEGVFTACIAWIVFRENVDRRVFLGMMAIVAGGVVLSWSAAPSAAAVAGPLLIAAACLAWGIDNNLTRRVSGGDAVLIAGLKGLIAGPVNLGLGLWQGAALPAPAVLASAAAVGLLGYGVSLVLFVIALRHLGTARTGAYFSVAPFVGAAIALAILPQTVPVAFWIAAALMAAGVWLHLTEHHEHEHIHEHLRHTHEHTHDEHHRHAHPESWNGVEPHSHEHEHGGLRHSHPHYPDLHHRHHHR
jgi:drug/metabolite transporter (DMT)-like permease